MLYTADAILQNRKKSFHQVQLYQLPKNIYPVLSIFKMYLSPHHLNWKRGPKQDPQKPVMSWNLILKFTFSRNHRSQIWVQVLSVLLAWESRAGADTDKLRVKIMRRWIRYWSNQIHHPQSFTQTAKYKTYKICHTWYSDSCLLSKTQLYIKISSPFQICLLNNRIGVSWSQTLSFILIILRSCFPVSNSQEGLTWESYLLVPT